VIGCLDIKNGWILSGKPSYKELFIIFMECWEKQLVAKGVTADEKQGYSMI
jgi:hypothetical protein